MSGDRGSHAHFGVQVGGDGRVTCHAYADGTPILAVDAGRAEVTISIAGRETTGAAVKFARALAEQARVFADEVERLHAAKPAAGPGVRCAGCGGVVDGTAA